MKKPIKISVYCLFLGLACLTQGCSDDLKTAFWWLPSPYMPVQFVTVDANQTAGGGAAGGGGGGGAVVGGGN